MEKQKPIYQEWHRIPGGEKLTLEESRAQGLIEIDCKLWGDNWHYILKRPSDGKLFCKFQWNGTFISEGCWVSFQYI